MKTKEKTTYIAFLRGINVGVHIVKMDTLRSLFASLGFINVRSYIQSGNIFFDSNEQDKGVLIEKIETKLQTSLGYRVPVCLRSIQELKTLLQKNPFKKIQLTYDKRFSVMLLPKPTLVDLPLPYFTPDEGYEVINKTETELFVVWHLKNGRPSNSYGLLEKVVQRNATTRFWHTLSKVFSAAQAKG